MSRARRRVARGLATLRGPAASYADTEWEPLRAEAFARKHKIPGVAASYDELLAGGTVAGYFLFQPNNAQPVTGDLSPGTVTTGTGTSSYAPRFGRR